MEELERISVVPLSVNLALDTALLPAEELESPLSLGLTEGADENVRARPELPGTSCAEKAGEAMKGGVADPSLLRLLSNLGLGCVFAGPGGRGPPGRGGAPPVFVPRDLLLPRTCTTSGACLPCSGGSCHGAHAIDASIVRPADR